jgi:CelD/BcsL family acetyltransferase involved in cellulose biosynthesis
MAKFERIPLQSAEWREALAGFPDRIVFQTPEWLAFLAETQGVEPVLAVLKDGSDTLGYVTGVILKKFGLRIFGSPIPGASTPYMGFNLRPGVPRRVAVEALPDLAFRVLRCAHFELVDAFMTPDDIAGLGVRYQMNPTLEVDLTLSEEEIFNNMTKSCRWTVRKAEKNGLVIEEAQDADFAGEVAGQLREVFAKHGLALHFGADRVRALIKHLQPTGSLLMLRARDPQGRCIGTGIYPCLHNTAFYLIGASWREHQKLYPNELLLWNAMLHWKRRGAASFNMVGNMEFKRKFGGRETAVPLISKSRNPMIGFLRQRAPRMARTLMRLAYRLKQRPTPPTPPDA